MNLAEYNDVIYDSIKNKYSCIDKDACFSRANKNLELLDKIDSKTELLLLPRVIRSAEDDILNQQILLKTIEEYWRFQKLNRNTLTSIYKILVGNDGGVELRRELHVSDFGGEISVPVHEIPFRFDELERLCDLVPDMFKRSNTSNIVHILSYIYVSIIRIHPFKDGNGRVARMYTLFALRCWDMPPIQIPKVRNDEAWKSALQEGLMGNYASLQKELLSRLTGRD